MEHEEKERKFLLKRLPSLEPSEQIFILQYYKDGYRYRMSKPSSSIKNIFEKIKKVKAAKGHNKELEIEEISSETFWVNKSGCISISKRRLVYLYDNKKFEVDDFLDLKLVMLEVEDVELSEKINFPPEIKSVLLLEVTGNDQFDNFNLAEN